MHFLTSSLGIFSAEAIRSHVMSKHAVSHADSCLFVYMPHFHLTLSRAHVPALGIQHLSRASVNVTLVIPGGIAAQVGFPIIADVLIRLDTCISNCNPARQSNCATNDTCSFCLKGFKGPHCEGE
jgi:hypothetical protein